jgi:hypothetical protein
MSSSFAYSGEISAKVDSFRDLGRKEAAKHLPPTDATYPDMNEVGLKSEAEKYIASAQRAFDGEVAETSRVILDVKSKLINLKSDIAQELSDSSLLSQVNAELADEKTKLVNLTAHRIQAEVDWRTFRVTNNITDMAHYPESHIWHWSLIITAAFIETLANAFFYQNANGLLGGFFVATAVSVVNIGSAAALGMAFRHKNLTAQDKKIIGWGALAVFAVLTLFCNALFSAFRSQYQLILDPSDTAEVSKGFIRAWSDAAGIFVGHLEMQDFSSFILFMTGIGLSIFAFYKGYTSDDRYPGYSKYDRVLKTALADEKSGQDISKRKLQDFLHSRRARVQGLLSATGTFISLLAGRQSALQASERALGANGASIQRDYKLVLDTYRQANLAIRGVPAPAYFGDWPDVSKTIDPSGSEAVNSEIAQLLKDLEVVQKEHRDDLNALLARLQEQMADILAKTFEAFLAEVEVDAKVQVQRHIQIMPGHQ